MTAEFVVAVHALEFLYHKGVYLSSEELADNVCTNPARVRKVLAKMEKAGLAESKNGHLGGYAFAGDAKTLTLLEIFRAVGGDLIKPQWRSGSTDMDCVVASGMAGIMDGIFADMEHACEGVLAGITLEAVNDRLFGERK